MGIKSKQVDKLLLARMLFTAMVVPATGSAADHILVNPTADATALAVITGNAYDGTDLPLVAATATTEGWVEGDIVQLLDSTNSAPLTFDGEELYARLSTDAANMKFSFFTNIDGVETAASIEEESIGAATVDILFSYRYKFANLPEDALIRTKRTYVGDDNDASGDNLVPYREVVTIDTQDTLPAPSYAVGAVVVGTTNTYDVKVFVNGIYEPLVAYDQPTNALTWDANTIGYTLMNDDEVVYQYVATVASLASLAAVGPAGTDISGTITWSTSSFGANISLTALGGNAPYDGFVAEATSGFGGTYVEYVSFGVFVPGTTYRIDYDVASMTGAAATALVLVDNNVEIPVTDSVVGTNSITFTAASNNVKLRFKGNNTLRMEVNSLGVYEL